MTLVSTYYTGFTTDIVILSIVVLVSVLWLISRRRHRRDYRNLLDNPSFETSTIGWEDVSENPGADTPSFVGFDCLPKDDPPVSAVVHNRRLDRIQRRSAESSGCLH